jgi:type II secretory pathway pseudopilin PulG
MPQSLAQTSLSRYRPAFSTLALMLTLIVCAAAATVGIPRWCLAGEREKTADALIYLESVKQAQVSYYADYGHFSPSIGQLDIRHPSPTHFSVVFMEADCGSDSWSLCLKRSGTWKYFGEYSLAYTQDGFDSQRSSVDSRLYAPYPENENKSVASR